MNGLVTNGYGGTERPKVDFNWLAERMAERPLTPAAEIAGVEITHEVVPAGKPVTVVSMRNAIFQGDPPATCVFAEDEIIRHLGYEGGEWMSDGPQEIWQMWHPLQTIRDHGGDARVLWDQFASEGGAA